MSEFQEIAKRLPEFVDKCTPYVKLDASAKKLRLTLISPENIGVPIAGAVAVGRLIDRANALLEKGLLLVDASGQFQIAPGADPRDLFEFSLTIKK